MRRRLLCSPGLDPQVHFPRFVAAAVLEVSVVMIHRQSRRSGWRWAILPGNTIRWATRNDAVLRAGSQCGVFGDVLGSGGRG